MGKLDGVRWIVYAVLVGCAQGVGPPPSGELVDVRCEIRSDYVPSDRALADACYPLYIDPVDVTDLAHDLARDMASDGLGTEEELRHCLDGVFVHIPADDEAFERVCGESELVLGCTFPYGGGPEEMGGASYYIALRWVLLLTPKTFSDPVIRHEMIHRAMECLYGEGDADHSEIDVWLAYEGWEGYDSDPDGDGVAGCQSSCGGC